MFPHYLLLASPPQCTHLSGRLTSHPRLDVPMSKTTPGLCCSFIFLTANVSKLHSFPYGFHVVCHDLVMIYLFIVSHKACILVYFVHPWASSTFVPGTKQVPQTFGEEQMDRWSLPLMHFGWGLACTSVTHRQAPAGPVDTQL